jgi:hypothetical protein
LEQTDILRDAAGRFPCDCTQMIPRSRLQPVIQLSQLLKLPLCLEQQHSADLAYCGKAGTTAALAPKELVAVGGLAV